VAAPKKSLSLTNAQIVKARKGGASWTSIAKTAGCGWRTIKARFDAHTALKGV
jgi:hypothetical protein